MGRSFCGHCDAALIVVDLRRSAKQEIAAAIFLACARFR
jgi:hypothetical protein